MLENDEHPQLLYDIARGHRGELFSQLINVVVIENLLFFDELFIQ